MSLLPYPEYKDSGSIWLGRVPEHWTVCHAKRFLTVRSGDMISSTDETVDGYPIIGGNGVRAFTNKSNTGGDTLVIGRVGAKCGCVHHIREDFWASEHAYRVVERKPLSRRFFYHLLSALDLNRFAIKTAQPLLNTTIVEDQRISVPDLREQRAIAAFLDRETAKIDALVAEQERLITVLKEKRQAVISHAVTKGLDPDAPMKDSGIEWLGEIPAHWEVMRLASLYREASRTAEEPLPILSVSIHTGVSDYELSDDEVDRVVARSDDRSKYKHVQPNDLVYNMMRAWQGGFGTVRTPGLVSPAYVVAESIQPIRTEFVEALLRTPNAVEEMRRYSRGVTDFRLRLYWDEFKNLGIALPPPKEVDAILAHLTDLTEQHAALENTSRNAIALLEERRAALISAAVTGKIDVRGLVEQHEMEAA